MSGLGALAASVGVDSLERPFLLVLCAALAVSGLVLALRRPPPALPWPAWSEALEAGARRRELGRGLALAARTAALLLLGVALAGPVSEHRAPPPPGSGLDLVLAVDASDSMRALDAELDGGWHTRLELARRVVARFARERAAEGDRVALVVFGDLAFTQCPLTSDGRLLAAALDRVRPGVAGGATALGDALALSVKRVSAAKETQYGVAPRAGRLVVLLTDGRSNAGAVPIDLAAGLAAARGVRVHTVGIGSTGEVAIEQPDAAGRGLRFERHDLDAETLGRIAEATGGRYFAARSSADLAAVYAEIDALERVARRAPARPSRAPYPEPWLTAAALLLALEVAGARGLARRIP
jgi:Ca-activated chloride channel family protein